jgi:hypothetical protein
MTFTKVRTNEIWNKPEWDPTGSENKNNETTWNVKSKIGFVGFNGGPIGLNLVQIHE